MNNKKIKGVLAAAAAILSLHMGTIYAAESVPASLDADTLEYDMRTGEATATGYVLLTRGDSHVTGTARPTTRRRRPRRLRAMSSPSIRARA